MSSHTGNLSEKPYWLQLLVLLGLWMAAFIGFSLVGAFIQLQLIGVQGMTPSDWEHIEDRSVINTYRWLQIILSAAIFITPAVIFAKMRSGDISVELGLDAPLRFKVLILTIVTVVASWPFVYLLLELNQAFPFPESVYESIKAMEDRAQSMLKSLILIETTADFFVVLLMVAIIPAVGEELLFRGAMQPLLIKVTGSAIAGILLCGFIFSFMHMQFLGFLPRMGLGVMFGFIFYYTGSMWAVIVAHFVHNGAQLLVFNLHEAGVIDTDPESAEIFPAYAGIFSLLLVVGLMMVFKKDNELKK